MKTTVFILKTNVMIIGLMFFTLGSLNIVKGQVQEQKLIRINLNLWEYSPVPNDGFSIERLGKFNAYYIFIYSSEFIKSRYKTNQESIRLTGNSGHIAVIDNDKKGSIAINTARHLLNPNISDQVISLFEKGGRLEVIVINDPLPPYVDIPVPSGLYHIAYVVRFISAKPDHLQFICPWYREKPCAHEKLWGPTSVEVYSNNVTEIEFSPQAKCCCPVQTDISEISWEDTTNFWSYIEYLNWAGEIF